MTGQIRVVVTDRDARVREHLTTLIDDEPDMRVVATAATAAQVQALVAEHQPHVVVIDPQLADHDDSYRRLQALSPRSRCLIHATGANGQADLLQPNSTSSVVLKQLNSNVLVATIRDLATTPGGSPDHERS